MINGIVGNKERQFILVIFDMFLLYLIKDFKALGVAAKARGIDKDCKKKIWI